MTEVESQLRELMGRLNILEDELSQARDIANQALMNSRLNGGGSNFGGGNGGLIRAWFPTGMGAAASFGAPASKTDVTLAVRSGNGWTTSGGQTGQTVYSSDLTAVTGAKAGWVIRRDDGTLEAVVLDC